MDKRSSRIQELREKNALKCMWGLFSILESCQGHPSHRLISNGRRVDKPITDYPRRSFDEECRRIQMKTQKRERKSGEKAYQLSCCLDNTMPSTSAEMSLKKLTLAAILEAAAVSVQNNPEDSSKRSEYDETHIQQIQMRAKAFVDHNRNLSDALNEGQTAKRTVKSILDAQFSERESMKRNVGQKSDKIVILKPAGSENVSSTRVTRSFSFREMKRKLKHTFGVSSSRKERTLIAGNSEKLSQECICGGVDIRNSATNSEQKTKKKDVKTCERKKLDLSSHKREFDVILEARRHLSARLRNVNSAEEGAISKKSPKTLQRVLSSPEHDFRPRPRVSGPIGLIRSNTEVTSSCGDHDRAFQLMEANCSSTPTTEEEEEVHDSDVSTTDNTKFNEKEGSDMNKCGITTNSRLINDAIKPQKDDELSTHSTTSDSISVEALTSTGDDFPPTHFSICKLHMAKTIKYHEEHRSPVSVLEPFFVEDAESPLSTTLQSARKQLQPRRLDFEECSFESIANLCMEDEDHLMQYVQSIVQASNLNWDQLSQISYPPEELLHESLFDEVDLPPLDCYYDPKLLFDHINEVLMEMYKCHCCSPHRLPLTMPRIMCTPLAEVVLDEIMTEADFYLLPVTERRTLDQIVSKDVAKCRSWLDVRLDMERIVRDISDDVLMESILGIVLEFTL